MFIVSTGIQPQIFRQWQESIERDRKSNVSFIDVLRQVRMFPKLAEIDGCRLHMYARDLWEKNEILTWLLPFIELGTLEEIILQRQIQKGSLADMTMDRAQKSNKARKGLNADELRDCFTLKDESCVCDTRQKVGNWPDYGEFLMRCLNT